MTQTLEVPPASSISIEDEIDRILSLQRKRSLTVRMTDARERIAKIRKIEKLVLDNREVLRKALWDDYRKSPHEVDLTELFAVVREARHTVRHLRRWMKPKRVAAPLALFGTRSEIRYDPKGVVLIVSPWNFPVNLTLGPLISAIAAGNCAILKPSEMTPNSSAAMKRLLATIFPEDEVAVVEGDAAVASALLRRKFDHIFFTGSPAVGKIVMRAAAENLTSVTLELGGKSPVIVDRTADVDEAAKKIAWGKFLNNGQICIAPDYLFVDAAIRDSFVEKLAAATAQIYGNEADNAANPDYGRIVNQRHFTRVRNLLTEALASGAAPVFGGKTDAATNYIAPTLLRDVSGDSRIMSEEIFGPLLPMLVYDDIEEPIRYIREHENPLALYVFSRDRSRVERVLKETVSGDVAVNDTHLHFFQSNLPFGGVGNSGVGKAHGFFGFEAFSNARGVIRQPFKFSSTQFLYPPYGRKLTQKVIDLTLKYF